MTYVAVVLTEESQNKLINKFIDLIPKDWELIAHHMTMYMGKIKPEDEHLLNEYVTLTIEKCGKNDLVIAVGVNSWEVKSVNKVPHITLAVNRKDGGKPVMSNQIANWITLQEPFNVRGIISQEK